MRKIFCRQCFLAVSVSLVPPFSAPPSVPADLLDMLGRDQVKMVKDCIFHPSRSYGFSPSSAWKNPLENSLQSASEIILKQLLQVKAAPVCPAGLQKGDPPGKVTVYGGILPPEQGLQPPADLFPAALTCENEGE